MKKLMIAAAAAAMIGGAYAGACSDIDAGVVSGNCMVYDVKLNVKTLAPKKMKCAGETCSDCASYVYYLDNASRSIVGYAWLCYEDCIDDSTDMNLVLWEKKTKVPVVTLPYAYEDGKFVQYPNTFNFSFIGRYGKKAKKVAAAWELDTEFIAGYCAGLNGSCSYDKDFGTAMLKNVSGNFAGLAVPATIVSKKLCEDPEEIAGLYAGICDCWESWCDSGDEATDGLPSYGTWSIKYNKSLSKGGKSMLQLVPSYALELED